MRERKEFKMDSNDFRLLVIADLHHVPGAAGPTQECPLRRVDMAAELLRRAIDDAGHRGSFDAIALMGDLLDNGRRPDSQAGLEQLRDVVRAAAPDKPLLLVPGNHDGEADPLYAAFQCRPGLHTIGPYRFMVFADRYAPGDFCTRSEADRRALLDLAAQEGGPIVVLQHNPMNPSIDDPGYPYMLTNRPEVMADYRQAKVLLSLSGHAHWGQELNFEHGVGYFTCPALCESPYHYAIVTLRGREVSVCTHRLKFDAAPQSWVAAIPGRHLPRGGQGWPPRNSPSAAPPMVDVHVHTEFAFCGKNISAPKMIARAREFGLSGLVLTEHVPQLYVQADDFWNGRHVRQIGLWRDPAHWRIEQFRAAMDPVRDGSYVKIGLEVEVDAAGELILRDEDRDWADVLVGAVHFLPEEIQTLSDQRMAEGFMKTTGALLRAGVHVLAHPLRLFGWSKQATPPEVFDPLAKMLAEAGTAAEINFHLNRQHEEFFRRCIERGVKIAFGSDSHEVHEAGNLGANLDLVQRIAGRQDVRDLLWQPKFQITSTKSQTNDKPQ
jgi:histidinol phosphatase-like PHP family hydrolase